MTMVRSLEYNASEYCPTRMHAVTEKSSEHPSAFYTVLVVTVTGEILVSLYTVAMCLIMDPIVSRPLAYLFLFRAA
jgi:hypothetical protein